MKQDDLIESYLEYLEEGNLAAAAYAAGKTANVVTKPIRTIGKYALQGAAHLAKTAGRSIKDAALKYAKDKIASFRRKGPKPEGATSALIKGLRGKKP